MAPHPPPSSASPTGAATSPPPTARRRSSRAPTGTPRPGPLTTAPTTTSSTTPSPSWPARPSPRSPCPPAASSTSSPSPYTRSRLRRRHHQPGRNHHRLRRISQARPPAAARMRLARASPGEGEVGDAAGGRHRLHAVLLLQRLQAIPQPDTAAEEDRDLDDMQVVDEPGGEELTQRRRAAPDVDVLAGGRLASGVERLRRRGVEEVERCTAVHLQRWARAMGQDVRWRVERRIVTPPSAPLRVVLPAWGAELAGAHDLRTDAMLVTLGEGVVHAGSAGSPTTWLDDSVVSPEPGREHPFMEPMTGVAEWGVRGLAFTGGESVERDREVVDSGARHGRLLRLSMQASALVDLSRSAISSLAREELSRPLNLHGFSGQASARRVRRECPGRRGGFGRRP